MNNTTQEKAGEAMSFTQRFPHFLHGGDYNPDQWLDRPDILERDVQLMQEAHVNAVSVGIFSLTLMEPEEGGTSSNGWTGSSTGCGAAASMWCWPCPPARVRFGRRRSTLRCCASMTGCSACSTASGTITA